MEDTLDNIKQNRNLGSKTCYKQKRNFLESIRKRPEIQMVLKPVKRDDLLPPRRMETKPTGFDIFHLSIWLGSESLMILARGRHGNTVFKLPVGLCTGTKCKDSNLTVSINI